MSRDLKGDEGNNLPLLGRGLFYGISGWPVPENNTKYICFVKNENIYLPLFYIDNE